MADWEYKEANWRLPESAKLKDQRNGDAYLEQSGRGYILKDGYPIEIHLMALKNTEIKQFPAGRNTKITRNILPLKDGTKQVDEFNSKSMMDFTTWLGHHSREGWEIFKISREFRNAGKGTWCIFKRKMRD